MPVASSPPISTVRTKGRRCGSGGANPGRRANVASTSFRSTAVASERRGCLLGGGSMPSVIQRSRLIRRRAVQRQVVEDVDRVAGDRARSRVHARLAEVAWRVLRAGKEVSPGQRMLGQVVPTLNVDVRECGIAPPVLGSTVGGNDLRQVAVRGEPVRSPPVRPVSGSDVTTSAKGKTWPHNGVVWLEGCAKR